MTSDPAATSATGPLLSTMPFRLSGSDYMGAYVRYRATASAIWGLVWLTAVVAAGAADLRLAIAALMLSGVMLPMAALLLLDRLMRRADCSRCTRLQQVEIGSDRRLTVTYLPPESESDDGSDAAPSGEPGQRPERVDLGRCSLSRSGQWLVAAVAHQAPVIIPLTAVTAQTPPTADSVSPT